MVKTLIFDCDGVMFQSREANKHYYNTLLIHFGFPEMSSDELDYVHIHNVNESVTHIFRNSGQDLGQVHRFRQQIQYTKFLKYMEIEPDLKDFLHTAGRTYNLAVATNRTDTMDTLLREFDLERAFGIVKTATNSRKPKPAPDPLLEIIDFFSCTVAESIYVGDSVIDEETAKGCGMRFIAFRNKQLTADFHVDSFTEIQNKVLPVI